mgnify:CR=1 FL=1
MLEQKEVNPFNYFDTEEDVLNFTKNVIKSNKDDPLENASIMLANSIIFYIVENCIKENWNIYNIKKLIKMCSTEEKPSTIDVMFGDLDANSNALSFYKCYKIASGDNYEAVIKDCLEKFDSFEIKKNKNTLLKRLIRKIKGVKKNEVR